MTSLFRCLISYHYVKHHPSFPATLDQWFTTERDDVELFIDSGAFSALTQGAEIDVRDYGRWLVNHNMQTQAAVIANLDVIGRDDRSAQATYDNQRILTDEFGLRVLPVVHAGEPLDWIDRYIDEGYRYIALGGLVGQPWKHAGAWVNQAFKLANCHGRTPEERSGSRAVFHGFGLTSQKGLRDFPWYSVDSSSWGSGYRYGLVKLFSDDPRAVEGGPGILTAPLRELSGHGDRSNYFRGLIRKLGINPDDLLLPGRPGRFAIATAAALSFQAEERWLRNRWGPVTIPDGPGNDGLVLYLAESDGKTVAPVAEGLRLSCAMGNAHDTAIDAVTGIRCYAADSGLMNLSFATKGLRGDPSLDSESTTP